MIKATRYAIILLVMVGWSVSSAMAEEMLIADWEGEEVSAVIKTGANPSWACTGKQGEEIVEVIFLDVDNDKRTDYVRIAVSMGSDLSYARVLFLMRGVKGVRAHHFFLAQIQSFSPAPEIHEQWKAQLDSACLASTRLATRSVALDPLRFNPKAVHWWFDEWHDTGELSFDIPDRAQDFLLQADALLEAGSHISPLPFLGPQVRELVTLSAEVSMTHR